MDIPGAGEVKGHWDLRDCIKPYLGDYDFKGKRVLDVGAASGFLTFSMEKQGADVVSFDMASGAQWDVVPQRKCLPRGCTAAHTALTGRSESPAKEWVLSTACAGGFQSEGLLR